MASSPLSSSPRQPTWASWTTGKRKLKIWASTPETVLSTLECLWQISANGRNRGSPNSWRNGWKRISGMHSDQTLILHFAACPAQGWYIMQNVQSLIADVTRFQTYITRRNLYFHFRDNVSKNMAFLLVAQSLGPPVFLNTCFPDDMPISTSTLMIHRYTFLFIQKSPVAYAPSLCVCLLSNKIWVIIFPTKERFKCLYFYFKPKKRCTYSHKHEYSGEVDHDEHDIHRSFYVYLDMLLP